MLIGRGENQHAPLGRHRGQQLGGNAGLDLLAAGFLRTGNQGIAGPVGERLIGAHTHESVAVDVDHRHEHAIRILIVAGGKRPFDVLLGPGEHVGGERSTVHHTLGKRADVPVQHGHAATSHAPATHERRLGELEPPAAALLLGAKLLVRGALLS